MTSTPDSQLPTPQSVALYLVPWILCLLGGLWTVPVAAEPILSDRVVESSDVETLHEEALELLQQGNSLEAFQLWQQELELRQELGIIPEIQALSRVGAIAWSEGELVTLRQIMARLDQIQGDVEGTDQETLQELGVAYQQLRSPQSAVGVYQKLLDLAIEDSNEEQQNTLLGQIAQTHLNWFDYPQAVAGYEGVLSFAQEQEDFLTQIQAYQQLAYSYEQMEEWEGAIATRLNLINLYDRLGQVNSIPKEQIAIAKHYETLGNLKTSAQLYEQAYLIAFEQQHLAYAAEALQSLGILYNNQQKFPEALAVYRSLLGTQAQAYDAYGMMNTYERIAEIHSALDRLEQALAALERGLKLAQHLNVRTEYYTELIQGLMNNE
ncbi:tetratricopeptide repeat protein [Roseofilum sp. Belize Diploria]|uniref:tetratricopeptide repeat protein n=1 Tax=Roseofilum sp. Belize Diploria TaxID=2821501 RepID=UPI001B093F97|nr:tetratricopeptide repeat protein [Roseofilum sp. Belize Diploria]MBP0007456.1 tetratricopeptide repeat protein [Roseofilum sp. Belize Diploria]